jgi:hypothetical protein
LREDRGFAEVLDAVLDAVLDVVLEVSGPPVRLVLHGSTMSTKTGLVWGWLGIHPVHKVSLLLLRVTTDDRSTTTIAVWTLDGLLACVLLSASVVFARMARSVVCALMHPIVGDAWPARATLPRHRARLLGSVHE